MATEPRKPQIAIGRHRIYVASSWRNPYQPEVVSTLRSVGHYVYDFRNPSSGGHGFHWSDIDPEWQTWTADKYRTALDHPIAVAGFKSDWDAMRWADTCVLVLPSGRSAHIEAGCMVGWGKNVYVLVYDAVVPELMYKMADDICLSLMELVGRLERLAKLTL